MSVAVDSFTDAEQQIIREHQLREKVVNEEFKIWKKSVPLLYNTIHTHALKWPSLTIDFSPKYTVSDDKNSILASFVVGTNTSSREQDTVSVHTVKLPSTLAPDFGSFSTSESIPIPLNESEKNDVSVLRSWNHAGEVNRAKFSPNGERFVTFDNEGVVHLYNLSDDAQVDFKYHTSEGYCLEWISDEEFLSGANDSKIALWNINSPAVPLKTFNTHSAVINDISFSKPTGVLFASVADDFTTQIHDLRAPEESPAIKITEKHLQNAVQFHPDISYLFATGGKGNVVNIYDARNPTDPIRQLYGHNDSIFGLRWSTVDPLSLHSWGLDKRVITWDLNYLTEDYNPQPADGAETKKRSKHSEDPCLQFIHAGHTNRVNDLAVHPSIPNVFATVGDDTLLEIYQPKTLREGDEHEEEEEEEEEEENVEENENNGENTEDKQDAEDNDVDADADDDDEVPLPVHDRKPSVMGINSKPLPDEDNSNSDVEMGEYDL